jgi:hypothetical protein
VFVELGDIIKSPRANQEGKKGSARKVLKETTPS